ncbi:MAG: HAD-IA family hydrolase [Thermodesulfobacteriota bacterium]
MNINNIKAVFFDAADTLFYIKDGLGKTYADPARKYGADPTPEELKKAFSKYFPKAPPLAFETDDHEERKILEKDWWYNVVRNVYTDVGMFKGFDEYFHDLFEIFRTHAWEIFPETNNVLASLRSKKYKLVVVSNFDSRVYDVCKQMGIYHYFDDFVISSEAGYAKPSIEIFQLALKRNSLNPDQCIHIGDDFINDYICPARIGINALYLDREDKNNDNGINKIKDLEELLGKLN